VSPHRATFFNVASRSTRRLAAVAGGFALTLAAAGQPARAADPGDVLTASVSGETLYDTDVAQSDAQIAAERGIVLADEIYTPSVTVDAVKPLGRENVFLHAIASYDFYQHNTILDRERLNLNAGGGFEAGPCQATLTGDFARHQSDLQDLNLAVVRNVEQNESIGLDAGCPKPIGLSPTLSVTQVWDGNSDALVAISNYNSLNVTAGLAYSRPIFGQASIYGQYISAKFPNRLVFGAGGPTTDGYSLYAGGLRYDRKLGARIEATFKVAYVTLRPVSTATPGFSGLTYAGDVWVRATGKIKLHAHAERDTNPSNEINTTYTIEQNYLVEATYAASSRASLAIGASDSVLNYEGGSLVSAIDITHEQRKSAFATLTLAVGRRLAVIVDVREVMRTASLAAYNYDGTRVGLTLKATF
jgi:hypothetical protein